MYYTGTAAILAVSFLGGFLVVLAYNPYAGIILATGLALSAVFVANPFAAAAVLCVVFAVWAFNKRGQAMLVTGTSHIQHHIEYSGKQLSN